MTFRVLCVCGAKLDVKDKLLGQRRHCPKCNCEILLTPSAESDSTERAAILSGPETNPERNSSKLPIIVGTSTAVVLLLIAAICYLVFSGDNGPAVSRNSTEISSRQRNTEDDVNVRNAAKRSVGTPISSPAEAISQSDSPAKSSQESKQSLTFADRTWAFAGPSAYTRDTFRPSMSCFYYTTDDKNLRLIELVPRNSSSYQEGVFSRILAVHINENGRWIRHGPTTEWLLDGGRGEFEYVHSKIHGTQREWYTNGQLRIEREWLDGKMLGRDRGWHKNGNPSYEVQNVPGGEIDGKTWDENGQPYK